MPEGPMIFTIALMTIVIIGIAATMLAQPRVASHDPIWSDELERRLLRERKIDSGW
ncbi:MAG: hypothetical protein NVSMB64_02010 [Candidatus Velthaea sp.]